MMIGHDKIQKMSIVQFFSDWDKEPTPSNTSIVLRVAKDRSWADVRTPYGSKRVPDPDKHLKLIKEPLVVQLDDIIRVTNICQVCWEKETTHSTYSDVCDECLPLTRSERGQNNENYEK